MTQEQKIIEIVDMHLQPLEITGLSADEIHELEEQHDELVGRIATAIVKALSVPVSERDVINEREKRTQERYPVFSQNDAEAHRERRYIFGTGFEQGVEWLQSHSTTGEGETKAIQKSDRSYNLACQNCGTTSKPLQMIPFRNDNNVVGLLTACNDCKDILYGQRFDREEKFSPPVKKEE